MKQYAHLVIILSKIMILLSINKAMESIFKWNTLALHVHCLVTSYDTVTKLTVMNYILSHHSILTRTNKYVVNNSYVSRFFLIYLHINAMFSIDTLFGLH